VSNQKLLEVTNAFFAVALVCIGIMGIAAAVLAVVKIVEAII
jgi:hypothetical protein